MPVPAAVPDPDQLTYFDDKASGAPFGGISSFAVCPFSRGVSGSFAHLADLDPTRSARSC